MLPDLNTLEYFHFLRPAWGLFLIPWIFVFFMLNKMKSGRDMFGGIIAPHLLEHLRVKQSQSRWANPHSFTKVIFFIILIVLMGPSWRQQPSPLIQDDAALVILLDASPSMTQRDIQPSRLVRAKQKISDLLALRPDRRAALVVYAGSAHTVLTLTSDQAILTQYLAAIKPGIMPRSGKFPEYALSNVDEILRQSSSPSTVVLITDGLGSDSDKAFATYFTEKSHQLLILGVGTDGSSSIESSAHDIIPLDIKLLKALAENSGGRYIGLSINNSDVKQLNRLVDSHYLVVEDSALPWLDSGYPLVFPAMALFLMWFRRGWTISWLWILAPLLLTQTGPVYAQNSEASKGGDHWFADLWLTGDQQGRLLMHTGAYKQAGNRFDDPMWKGLAYYYAEKFMQSAEYFSRNDSDNALFNEANARAQARDYLRAVVRYDRLLARTPAFPGAASNRAQVQQIIDETNRLSESQQGEAGVSGEELEPAGDDAVPAQGISEVQLKEIELEQLTAEQILQDPATSEMWLRSVQHDPANFLAMKFNMQLARKNDVVIKQDSEQ